MRSRVLVWTPLFWPDLGGIEIMTSRLVASLHDRGYDLLVLTAHGRIEQPSESTFHDIPVHRFRMVEALTLQDPKRVLDIRQRASRLIHDFAPDLIHLQFGGPAPVGYFHLLTRQIHPAPTIVSLHSSLQYLDTNPSSITGQLLRSASWMTACSAAMLEDAKLALPDLDHKSSLAYYGFPTPPIQPDPLPWEPPYLLCFGRAVHEKGFDIALDAFIQVHSRYPKARLILAGDGPELAELEAKANRLYQDHQVEFPGSVRHEAIYGLMNRATIVMVPSRYREGFGIIAVEAAQMARPVVASRVGGLPEAVLDGDTGLLVEPDDPQALASALLALLANPDRARLLGQAGRIRAIQQFSADRYVDTFDKLYQQMIGNAQANLPWIPADFAGLTRSEI